MGKTKLAESGRVDCKCGDQILSNSGKEMMVIPSKDEISNLIRCWNTKCKGVYHREDIWKMRKEGESTVFDDSTDMKVFKVGDGPSDWIAAKSKDEAISYYNENFDGEDYELSDYEEVNIYAIWHDEDGKNPTTIRKTIDQHSEFPCIIGSTEV